MQARNSFALGLWKYNAVTTGRLSAVFLARRTRPHAISTAASRLQIKLRATKATRLTRRSCPSPAGEPNYNGCRTRSLLWRLLCCARKWMLPGTSRSRERTVTREIWRFLEVAKSLPLQWNSPPVREESAHRGGKVSRRGRLCSAREIGTRRSIPDLKVIHPLIHREVISIDVL